ncbi:MAG: hypothetical protein JST00_03035 [Deltaproteobacteria bacterium]|nr:hypothetical protein [Deltaproteobacteria bacterium]
MIRGSSLGWAAGLVAATIVATACSSTEEPSSPSTCGTAELIVAASDYASSVVCGAPCCVKGPATSGVDLGRDPQLATSRGRVFFIARDSELLFELDPRSGRVLGRTNLHEAAAPTGVNPQDVAVAPDGSLWVALYSVPYVAIVRDGKIVERIDISRFDGDGNPQAASIRIVDVNGAPKAFVTLQRLDLKDRSGVYSKQPSQMIRIDVATRVVEATTELAGRNPFSLLEEHDGALFIAAPGSFEKNDETTAGIERFETTTGATRLVVSERALGGSPTQVAITDGCGAAIVAGPAPNVNPTAVVTFDPTTGAVSRPMSDAVLGPTPGYDLQGLAWRGNLLYVGDRRAGDRGYRVHVFERAPGTCNLQPVERALDLPERPVALRAAQ